MHAIRRDVLNLITANEKIQSLLLRGEELTKDEAAVVRMCATELLSRVPDRDAVDEPDGGVNTEPLNVLILRPYPGNCALNGRCCFSSRCIPDYTIV